MPLQFSHYSSSATFILLPVLQFYSPTSLYSSTVLHLSTVLQFSTVLPAPASYYQFYSSIVLHLSTVLQSYISLQFYSSLQLLLVTIMNTSSYLIVVTFYSTSIVPTPSRFPTPPTYHHYYYDQTTPLSSSYSFRSQWKRNHTAYPTPTTYLLPQLRLLLRQLLLVIP